MQAKPRGETGVPRGRQQLSYVIRVTQHGGTFELSIPELLLVVRAPSLQDGYDRLRQRQQELVNRARSLDALDDLPPPAPAAIGLDRA